MTEQEIYRSRRWTELSKAKRNADPFCEICARKGEISPSTTTHHIKAIKDGGDPWAWDNIEAVCQSCHAKIHN